MCRSRINLLAICSNHHNKGSQIHQIHHEKSHEIRILGIEIPGFHVQKQIRARVIVPIRKKSTSGTYIQDETAHSAAISKMCGQKYKIIHKIQNIR